MEGHRLLLSLLLLALPPAPQTLDPTLTPTAGAVTVATVQGRGAQVYACTPAASGSYAWTLQGPEATLFDTSSNKPLGAHNQGPTWTWNDGSAITGTVLTSMPSPDTHSVPWLLLKTQPAPNAKGMLAHVSLVRRSDTQGGVAPTTGCNAQHPGATARVPYSATYTFYNVPNIAPRP